MDPLRTKKVCAGAHNIRYVQINLKHSKNASDNLLLFMNENKINIAFIQEPWINKSAVKGLNNKNFNLFYNRGSKGRPRSCLLIKTDLHAFYAPSESDDDTVVVKLEEDGVTITLVSVYMPHDSSIPSNTLERFMSSTFLRKGSNLIIAGDMNARHTLWGSTMTNERGESFYDFITANDLKICNRGNDHTFCFPSSANFQGWSDVLDVTLSNNSNNFQLKNWHVSKENSFSDHRYIMFETNFEKKKVEPFRNPKNTDWLLFTKIANKKLDRIDSKNISEDNLECTIDRVEKAYSAAFKSSCKISKPSNKTLPPYFTKELIALRKKLRSQFNDSHRTGDWQTYKILLRLYTSAKRKAKRESWSSFCDSVDSINGAAKLKKILSRSPTQPTFLSKEDGSFTLSSEETNETLLQTHFPGCSDLFSESESSYENRLPSPPDNETIDNIVSLNKIEWAINSFEAYKSPGLDGICPKMLQETAVKITPLLAAIYRVCLANNLVPLSWRRVKVVFIPKTGRVGHSKAKDFRPISLTSFLLKTLERLLELHMRSLFKPEFISKSQHAYMKGKSTETALHQLVITAEKAIEHNQYALTAFLDIEGAFNNVTCYAIESAMRGLGVDNSLITWLVHMLNSRIVISEVGDSTVTKRVNRGTPQGGVISPLLWLLVINDILVYLDKSRVDVVAYADDVAISISGFCLQTISDLMSNTLAKLSTWAQECGLNVNPSKTELVLFTKKINIGNFRKPKLQGIELQLSNKAKFLGLILDSKLSWASNIDERIKKAQAAYYACRCAFGRSWGLSPKIVHWLYTAVIRPILLYGILVWWVSLSLKSNVIKVNRLQRSVALGITGAMKSNSGDALNAILSIAPIELIASEFAAKSAVRLKSLGIFKERPKGHSSILSLFPGISDIKNYDYISPVLTFDHNYTVKITERRDWCSTTPTNSHDVSIFTDGSKTGHGSGAGFWDSLTKSGRSFKLPDYSTVYQSELYAILMACEFIRTMWEEEHSIAICVDSQAALKALDSPLTVSKLAMECKSALSALGHLHTITLLWVPGHSNIEGNEKADLLARQGSSLHRSWMVKCYCPLSHPKSIIKKHTTLRWNKRWATSTTVASNIWTHIDPPLSKTLINNTRSNLRKITSAITGHWFFGKHGSRMGIVTRETCFGCNLPMREVDSYHFWCDCPSLAKVRMETLGQYFLPTFPSIDRDNLRFFIEYIKRSGWFSITTQ